MAASIGHMYEAAVSRGDFRRQEEDSRMPWQARDDNVVTAIDFYSGIGGNHYAFEEACRAAGKVPQVLVNVEINDLANNTYVHNFAGQTKLRQSSIEGVKKKELVQIGADVWLASPPCQPYTRPGLRLGSADKRAVSFFYLLDTLEQMHHSQRPGMLFVENVRNFESSDTRDTLVSTLTTLGYDVREYLLNPNQQAGVPNSRMRYYLIAKQLRGSALSVLGEVGPSILTRAQCSQPAGTPPTLQEFLPQLTASEEEELLLPEAQVCSKVSRLLDLVFPHSRGTMCFTKGYAQYFEGTGSYMCTGASSKEETKRIITEHEAHCPAKAGTGPCPLMALRIRRFAPREVSRLLCFPPSFTFHPDASVRQQYRLLGNSVNIAAVTSVLTDLLQWRL